MSYIECKSFVTGKENVQYPLIDVELKHKVKNENISCNCDLSNTYWNTAPLPLETTKLGKNSSGNFGNFYCYSRGISGRRTQGYNASGELSCNYTYVPTGPFPIISQQIINESNLNEGVNTFDLFETTNIKVILEVTKAKENIVHPYYNHTYIDLDGTTIENPDVIASITVVQILKSNNKIISQLEMSQLFNHRTGIAIPIEFTLNTALFRITNFNPKYATYGGFNSRYGMWLDNPSGIGNKMYKEGELTENEGDFIGMQFTVYATEYWSGNVPSGDNTCYRCKIINADGSEVTDSNKKKLNTNAVSAWMNNEINVNPNTFIKFLTDNSTNGSNQITNSGLYDFAESYSNGNKEYKTKIYSGDIDTIYGSHNMFASPIVVPYVMSDYSLKDSNYINNGIYIPLTSTVFEGDPEKPDDPDEPETVEPADDPETDYTPSLPGDTESGEETWVYPGGDIIGGDPGAYNLFRPSYSNFIFNKYYKGTTEWNQDSAWEFINDCMNASASEWIHTTYSLVTGKPELGEIVARVYDIPFEYTELFNDSAGIREATPVYGYIGPLTFQYNIKGEPQGEARYYKEIVNRFYPLDLGTVNIQKVFNNYLDYTDTIYKLNLPYGAGIVELDPNILFNVGVVTANIKLKGYLDFDTGMLIIKVIVNNQLYYETSVNVAVDRVAIANSNAAVQSFFAKATLGIASAVALKSYRSLLHDSRSREAEEKYQEHRKQRKDDQIQRDAQIVDRENKIQENYNNTWFDRYYKDYELKEKLIDKQTEFMRAQTEAAKELMKTGLYSDHNVI